MTLDDDLDYYARGDTKLSTITVNDIAGNGIKGH